MEDDFEVDPSIGQCEVFQSPHSANHFYIYLDKDVSDPSYYRQAFHTVRTATELDTIELLMNSPGGHISTAIVWSNLIRQSEANIIAVLEGATNSAMSMIALACSSIVVNDYAHMMIHSASFGSFGTSRNVKDQLDFVHQQTTRLVRDVYRGFMLPEEIDEVLNNREFWFDDDEIERRLGLLQEYRQSLFEEQVGEDLEKTQTLKEMIQEAVEDGLKSYTNPMITINARDTSFPAQPVTSVCSPIVAAGKLI